MIYQCGLCPHACILTYISYIHICISCIHTYGSGCLYPSAAFEVRYTKLLHTLMGSHGDKWLRCCWCATWGKCLLDAYLPDGAVGLMDVDGVGVLCDPCLERNYPPHYDYLQGLLQTRLSLESAIELIADFRFSTCYRYRCQTDFAELQIAMFLEDKPRDRPLYIYIHIYIYIIFLAPTGPAPLRRAILRRRGSFVQGLPEELHIYIYI